MGCAATFLLARRLELPHAPAASRVERDPAALAYTRALAGSPFVRELLAGGLPLDWAATRMVSDDPAKGLGRAADDAFLWERLKRILEVPTRELALVSPYFVLGAEGAEFFAALARQGVG
jgi:putative cardiolipin synthase